MNWPHFTAACRKDVDRVLRSGKLTAYRANKEWGVGPQEWSHAYAFEREVEKAFKVKHAVAVNSGTAALHASLIALGVRGKEVITSPYTFSATASAILLSGGTPRFADVDPHTFCLTADSVRPHVTKKTAAILPVHLFGYYPDVSGLRSFGLPIIEDSCQAVGAVRDGHFSGTTSLAGCYSFNGSKNIPAGEGGCLVTNDDKIAEKARRFINHAENFKVDEIGVNYRMHELVAVLARHGLKELESRNQRRIDLASEMVRSLHSSGHTAPKGSFGDSWHNRPGFGGPHDASGKHVFYVYPFTVAYDVSRSRFIARCAKRGLQVGAGYITPPLHHYPAFRKYATRALPVVDELSSKTLCILGSLTPEKPLSYARWCAKVIRESLE